MTCIFFCSEPSVQFGLHRASGSFIGFRAAPKYQFIFHIRGGNKTFREVPNGLEGVDKAGLEVQVMSQIMEDGEEPGTELEKVKTQEDLNTDPR